MAQRSKPARKSSASKSGAKKASKRSSSTAAKAPAKAASKATAAKSSAGKAPTSAKKASAAAPSKPAAGKSPKRGKKAAKPKAAAAKRVQPGEPEVDDVPYKRGKGRELVIVESPAKAKTINKYLGSQFVVHASVGHIRDLPQKAERGSKEPVPGVDLEHDFKPTYVVLSGKSKTVAELKRLAKDARDVWFATDLDREGEAIAWHLAQVLGIPPKSAKRVVFNAITRVEVQRAFANPHPIDIDKVNAQQARRILDRIVGYQASPLLWKKVARGLSAGRVQSVAVRLVVEREREIRAFVPDETWRVTGRFALDPQRVLELEQRFAAFMGETDAKGKGPTIKQQNAWLAEQASLKAELVEVDGERFDLGCKSTEPKDLTSRVGQIAEACGLTDITIATQEDPSGKGPARFRRTVTGHVDENVRYRVRSIETKETTSRPSAPFITSSLQITAANQLGFTAQRTMRTAQGLYEGVDVPGEGRVGLITYMRTDSTNLSADALHDAREFIGSEYGPAYLPERANVYSSSNKDAQEAHEAIRPTDVTRTPAQMRGALSDEQYKLYELIWSRFVGCQMTPARWDATSVLLQRADEDTGATFKVTGRVLAFDGFYRATGVPTASDEQTLPDLRREQVLAPFSIEPEQRFSSPPPRYSEASLVKMLESEGIGRPSTYAQIIGVIQDRKYVEQVDRRFFASDLGEVVTDKMMEAFPELMDIGYTRQMEAELDRVEDASVDWVQMLHRFYGRFSQDLENAHDALTHAKAEIQPALYKCPKCGARTCYRFGKNGRFLSCTRYPDCEYSAPIDREGRPLLPERVDVACPEDGSTMELRTGRFGPFLASTNYPATTFVLNLDKKSGIKYPQPPPYLSDLPCPKCGAPLNLRRGKRGPWLGCSTFPKCRGRSPWTGVEEAKRDELEKALIKHEKKNPVVVVHNLEGKVIPEGTPIQSLVIPGGVAELEVHPEAVAELGSSNELPAAQQTA